MFGDRRVGHAMIVKCVGHAMPVVVIVISLVRDTSSYLTLRLLLKISGSHRSPFSTYWVGWRWALAWGVACSTPLG